MEISTIDNFGNTISGGDGMRTIYVVNLTDTRNDDIMTIQTNCYPTRKRVEVMMEEFKKVKDYDMRTLYELKKSRSLDEYITVEIDNKDLWRMVTNDGTHEVEISIDQYEIPEELDMAYLVCEVKCSVDEELVRDYTIYNDLEEARVNKNERIQKWTNKLAERLECTPEDVPIFAGTFIDEEDEDDHLWTFIDQEGWDEIRICIQPLNIWWKNDPTVY